LEGCTNIKELDISHLTQVTLIGNLFLKGCTSLETLILPPNIEYIARSFLEECTNIKELNVSHMQNNCCNKITTNALIKVKVNEKLMNWNLNYKSLTLFVSNPTTNKCNSIKGKSLYHFTTHIILNVRLNIQLGIL